MAKVVSDEILKLKIIINGDEAQKRVLDLELANKKLGTTLKDLEKDQARLSRSRQKNSQEYKDNEIAIKNLSATIANNKKEIDKEVRSMDIMSLTMQQLSKRTSELRFQLQNLNPNSPEFTAAQAELSRLNGRMTELRTGANASSFSIGRLADNVNRYSGMIAGAAAVMAGVALSIQSTIDLNNKLADAQTAVAKTTGLTNEEVKELTRSYAEFDTRTSRMDLLKISEIGGRLGVPKAEIKDFTKEVDKAYVALGDGFAGGVESVANKLGKIKGLFKETKDLNIAVAMNQIGSSLNELGAAGAASEENISDFALRVGALPNALKPTIAEALALGAAFEESGIDAERSGTAYSNLISKAAKDTAKFAQVMKIPTEEAKKLINTDPTEFFLKFSEGLKGMDATALAQTLEYLGLNDQYVKSIIGSASEDTDRFRKSILLSNEALEEATSLQIEFDKVNNNAAAVYDKVRKKFIGMFTSETVAKTLNFLIESIGKLLGVVEDASGGYRIFGQTVIFVAKLFAIGTVAIFSYNTAMLIAASSTDSLKTRLLAYTIVQKINNFLNQSGVFLQNLYTASILRAQVAYYGLTGATALQSAAQTRLNAIVLANPWFALIAVIAAVTAAYILFSEKLDEAALKQKVLNDIKTTAAQKIVDEKLEIEKLVAVAKSETASNEDRAKALKRLNDIIPDHIGLLNSQNIKTAEGVGIINKYIDALKRRAYAEAVNEKQKELFKKQIEIQGQSVDKGWMDLGGAGSYTEQKFNKGNLKRNMSSAEAKQLDALTKVVDVEKELSKYVPLVRKAYRERRDELREIYVQTKAINAEQKKLIATDPSSVIGGTPGDNNSNVDLGGGSGKTKTTKTKSSGKSNLEKEQDQEKKEFERLKEKILQSAKDYDQKFLDQESDYRMEKINLMEDGYDKEIAKIDEEEYRKRVAINKNMNSMDDYKTIEAVINKTSGAEKALFEKIRQDMLRSDEQYNAIEILAIEETELKKKAVKEKFIFEDIKSDEEEFNRQISEIKRQSDLKVAEFSTVAEQKKFLEDKLNAEQLSKITNWEEGKAGIEKYYQDQSLDLQEKYLQSLVEQLEELPTASLTPDQIQVLEAMRIKLAQIAAEKAKIKNGDATNQQGNKLQQFGAMDVDLLGLNKDQWKAMFAHAETYEEKVQKIGAAIQVTQQLFAKYFEFLKANEAANLKKVEYNADRKKKSLENQLKAGVINQEEYKRSTLEIDAKVEKAKAEAALRIAKREKAMAIASAISGTAMAVVGALGNKPWTPFNFALAGIVGAMGALQIGTILAQPLPEMPGAEDGLYPVMRSQDRKMFNARRKPMMSGMYDEPTVLVGEGGKGRAELVVDDRTLKRLKPTTVNTMMAEIAQIRGFEDGRYPNQNSTSTADPDYTMMIVSALNRYSTIMEKIEKNGIQGVFEKGQRVGKDLKDSIDQYSNRINNNKHG